jgi:amino-acid N-acetyltransferase
LARARERGVEQVFLLTETAPVFFGRLGFSDVDRAAVPDTIRATVEFASACPASARVMRIEV